MTYRYFPDDELRCKCGKCSGEMHPHFMQKLVALRTFCDFPFPVSSAYRCPAYNAKVSGTGAAGPHTTGRAVDIQVSGRQAFTLIANAQRFGFTGIGISQKGPHDKRFIHLDDLEAPVAPRPWIWSY